MTDHIEELRANLRFKGTRQHPKRKTNRRWWIASASISLGFASLTRRMEPCAAAFSEKSAGWRSRRGEVRAEIFQHLDDAANDRRMAAAHARNSYIKQPRTAAEVAA